MRDQSLTKRWLDTFPELLKLEPEHQAELLETIQFKRLSEGDVAYYQGQPCEAYVMCIEGRTRVFKTSESGRAILLYQVGPGETCVLTTSCLMACAGQIASHNLQAIPAPFFANSRSLQMF
jgi:CRP/FNR family transcriptional regulator